MKIFYLSVLFFMILAVNASPYTITNSTNLDVKVILQESFKGPEERILKPGEVWVKDTFIANCLDYVRAFAVNKDGGSISQHAHAIYSICAAAGTLCIVRIPERKKSPEDFLNKNLVEIRNSWTGTSAEACARGA